MSRSTVIGMSQSLRIRWSFIGRIALWGLQVGLAALFLLAGGSKLAGTPAMVALFDAVGVGQWFRYVTGLIEFATAVALLVPSLAPFGALALAATMAGATGTHLFVIGGSAGAPMVLLAGALGVVWARRNQLLALLSRWRSRIHAYGRTSSRTRTSAAENGVRTV